MTAARPKLSAEERRRHVLETASRVFADGTFRGTTTAEISRAVGCSEPILYRHFPSKRDLYFACIEHAWGELRDRLDVVLEMHEPEPALATLERDLDALARGKAVLAHFWVQGLTEASEDPDIRRFIRRHLKDVHAYLVRLLRHGQALGIIHPDRDAEVEAWLTIGTVTFGAMGDRLGGLMDDVLPRIRAQRRAWMTPEANGSPLRSVPR
jgi:AcrR family transcriptional regulator